MAFVGKGRLRGHVDLDVVDGGVRRDRILIKEARAKHPGAHGGGVVVAVVLILTLGRVKDHDGVDPLKGSRVGRRAAEHGETGRKGKEVHCLCETMKGLTCRVLSWW